MIVYFIEVGMVLVVTPWTRYWDRNYFVEALPLLEATLTSPVARGTVSGFGIVAIVAAVVDVCGVLRRRWGRRNSPSGHAVLVRQVEIASQDLREEVYPPSS